MEILDNIVRVLMYISLGLNIWGLILSMRVVKRARKSWKRANELADALAELHTRFLEKMDKGEEQ
jgi:hypothetical protein